MLSGTLGEKGGGSKIAYEKVGPPAVSLEMISRGRLRVAAEGSEDARQTASGSHELYVP